MSISILRDFENALLVAEFHSVQTARGMSHLLLRGSSGHFSWPGSLVLCGYMILNELNDVKWILHQFTIMNPLCNSKFLNDPEPYFLWMGMKNETVHLTLQISSNIYKNVSSWYLSCNKMKEIHSTSCNQVLHPDKGCCFDAADCLTARRQPASYLAPVCSMCLPENKLEKRLTIWF